MGGGGGGEKLKLHLPSSKLLNAFHSYLIGTPRVTIYCRCAKTRKELRTGSWRFELYFNSFILVKSLFIRLSFQRSEIVELLQCFTFAMFSVE